MLICIKVQLNINSSGNTKDSASQHLKQESKESPAIK